MALKDMFLKLDSAKAGPVKGESEDPAHPGEMQIEDFSWGMKASSSMGAGASSKAALSEVRLTKKVDSASTGLMSVMRNNDPVKKAVLSIRKAGGAKAIDYMVVIIERGRIVDYEISSESDSPMLQERFSIVFEKIEIQYASQDSVGAKLASSTFVADVGASR